MKFKTPNGHSTLKLYHYTRDYSSVLEIMQTRKWISKENPKYVYFTDTLGGQAEGYGQYAVSIDMDERYIELDDEFPNGEQHFRVLSRHINKYAQNYDVIFPKLDRESSDLMLFHCSDMPITEVATTFSGESGGDFGSTLFFAKRPYTPFGMCKYAYKLRCLTEWMIDPQDLQITATDEDEAIAKVRETCVVSIERERAHKLLKSSYAPLDLMHASYGFEESELYPYFGEEANYAHVDFDGTHKFAWWLQGKQSRIGKRMGYLGVSSVDEQGTVWMIDMLGKEYLLGDYFETPSSFSYRREKNPEYIKFVSDMPTQMPIPDGRRRNPKSQIKCFPPLRMYWFEGRDIETVGYHVTPYVDEILEEGYIRPSGYSNKSTLGSPSKNTISFSSNLDDAKALAQSLAIYALLSKGLMSYNEFKLWVKDNFDVRFKLDLDLPQIEAKVEWIQETYGGLPMEALEDGSWVDTVFFWSEHRGEPTNSLFETLHTLINFVDPKVYTDAWINDLPNDKDDLLSSIGIFECKLTSKTLVDPSLGRICYGGLYGTENAKGAEILGLDWESLWGGEYGTSESIEDINSEFRNIESFLADLQTEENSQMWRHFSAAPLPRRLSAEYVDEQMYEYVNDEFDPKLPYHDPDVEVGIVDEIPIAYCQNTILYFCYESEFTIFSEGIRVSERDVTRL